MHWEHMRTAKTQYSKKDEAWDFFSELDNTCYTEFKTMYLHNLQLMAYNTLADTYTTIDRIKKGLKQTDGDGR